MPDVTGSRGSLRPLEQVAAAARAGDAEARQELASRLLDDIRAYVRIKSSRELRERESNSDLVQSVCRELFQDLSGFEDRGDGSFRRWAFTLALNKVREKGEFLARQKRNPARELDQDSTTSGIYSSICALGPTPSQMASAREQVARIEAALDRLPEDYREVILQKQLLGQSHRQIAEQWGRDEGAVRVLLARARVRLLAELEER